MAIAAAAAPYRTLRQASQDVGIKRHIQLGSFLKNQPAFGYHQAMFRAVLTLLVGLMLSLGGAQSALTFKSDGTVVQSDGTVVKKGNPKQEDDAFICRNATKADPRIKLLGMALSHERIWLNDINSIFFVKEANRRRLDCGTNSLPKNSTSTFVLFLDDEALCKAATYITESEIVIWKNSKNIGVYEAQQRGLSCGVGDGVRTQQASSYAGICEWATYLSANGVRKWETVPSLLDGVLEAKRRGLTCGVGSYSTDANGHQPSACR